MYEAVEGMSIFPLQATSQVATKAAVTSFKAAQVDNRRCMEKGIGTSLG